MVQWISFICILSGYMDFHNIFHLINLSRVDGIKTVHCENLCGIRQCALKKGVETCGGCPDLEICQTVGMIISNSPDALKNLRG